VKSSIVSPNLIASVGSEIISPASAARMWAPTIFFGSGVRHELDEAARHATRADQP
jgi:hypothetical protein